VKETEIVKSIMLALGNESDFRLWRNNVGKLPDVTGRVVSYGLAPGSADLIGILAPWGRLIALEVKTHRKGSRQSEDQRNWERVIREMGGVYEVVRSAADALEVLRVAREFRGVQRLKVEVPAGVVANNVVPLRETT
jgi:hypothetical protein